MEDRYGIKYDGTADDRKTGWNDGTSRFFIHAVFI